MASIQLVQQLACMVEEVSCALVNLLGFGMVVGVRSDVAHLPETAPDD
ncbi:MAG: hypothetical protein KGN37_13650 [Burkholderiales bacterium]|nr:hypothetical protein [Burkholderiales bacterium]